jgi:hypothetical protein
MRFENEDIGNVISSEDQPELVSMLTGIPIEMLQGDQDTRGSYVIVSFQNNDGPSFDGIHFESD